MSYQVSGRPPACSTCGRYWSYTARYCEECGARMDPAQYCVQSQPQITYAGFWRRTAAYLIDFIVLAVCVSFLTIFSILASGGSLESAEDVTMTGNLLGLVVTWLYYAAMESSPLQATLGKMALGILVTDMNGARLSFGRATGRHFGKIISSFFFGIGFMLAGWTKYKQALHDDMSGSLVVCRWTDR